MPIYSLKEFKQRFNVSTQYISVNKKRGKLIVQGKFINSEVPENKAWLEEWHYKNSDQQQPEQPPEQIPKSSRNKKEIELPEIKRKAPKEIDIPEASNGPVGVGQMSRHELDTELKKMALKKAQEDYELAVIKKEKLLGLVIPTELVFGVFSRHFKSVTDSYYQALDNALVELIPGRKDLSEARARLVDIINGAVDDAKQNSKKEIDALLSEYSESRGKGESKS